MIAPVAKIGRSILSSLTETLKSIFEALRERKLSKLVSLLKEGSPLEKLIDNVLLTVFWVLVVAPVVLAPLYFLALSVAQ
ncbi:MAG: hypothetical protein HY296_03095 [Thaumarchaeota archaeon]|nr:hypothetical protein [Nitrososphaerota archaeon]